MIKNATLALAACTAFIANPTAAQPPEAVSGRTERVYSVSVPLGELELADEEGARDLRQRVWLAAVSVCRKALYNSYMGPSLIRSCSVGALKDATAQIDQAIAEARGGNQFAVKEIRIRLAAN